MVSLWHMLEKHFQTEFGKWLKHKNKTTGAFELKLTKETSLPFNAVQPHQVDALRNAKHGHLMFKIPDDSISQKPFDCFMLVGCAAYVVIMYYVRGKKAFYMIDIDDWMREELASDRKSLTEDRAREIGITCELA